MGTPGQSTKGKNWSEKVDLVKHQKFEELYNRLGIARVVMVKDKASKMFFGPQQAKQRWNEHFQTLMNDDAAAIDAHEERCGSGKWIIVSRLDQY